MGRKRHLGFATFTVLRAVKRGFRYGFDIMDATSLPAGTVYPSLSRLEELALLRSRWENPAVARREKRPARRYYEVTASGDNRLREELEHYGALERAEGRRPVLWPEEGAAGARGSG